MQMQHNFNLADSHVDLIISKAISRRFSYDVPGQTVQEGGVEKPSGWGIYLNIVRNSTDSVICGSTGGEETKNARKSRR